MTLLSLICAALLAICIREFARIRTYLKQIESLDEKAAENNQSIIP